MNILEILKSIIIGIVQGITEWLPVSSTGHMIILNKFMNLNVSQNFMEMFLVVVQLGSILAVIFLFFHKLNPFSPKKNLKEKKDTISLWGKVVVGSIPAVIVGFTLDKIIHTYLYGTNIVSLALVIYGIAFIVIENSSLEYKIKNLDSLNYRTALLIGCFQTLALIPGTSRSGATIVGAMLLGAARPIAMEFSFFLAIPVMFGASGYEILKYFLKTTTGLNSTEIGILISGIVVAFIVSVITIKFLLDYVKKNTFKNFGWYRIILGIIILVLTIFKL